MNFAQLNYALAIKRSGHFGKAADSCHVTQATLSGMLKRLEDELGYRLFDRSSHPITPTEKGERFLKKAEEILALQEEVFSYKKAEGSLKGKINVGIIPTISSTLLPLILPEFLKEHPELRLSILESTTEDLVSKLNSREIDFAILATPLSDKVKLPFKKTLYYESMMIYGVHANVKNFKPHHLKKEKVWLLEDGHCFRNQSMAICELESERNETAQVNFKSNSFDTLINLSDQFGGYTLIPELYAKLLERPKRIRCRSFNTPIPVREVSLVSYSALVKQNAIEAMSEHIKAIVPPLLDTADRLTDELDVIAI